MVCVSVCAFPAFVGLIRTLPVPFGLSLVLGGCTSKRRAYSGLDSTPSPSVSLLPNVMNPVCYPCTLWSTSNS